MGEYQHALDEKGRLIIPSRFRQELGEQCVVTRGLDQCIFLFAPAQWAALEQKLQSLPLTKADARSFVRFLLAGASECEPDRQGRIILPANLREYAGIERDVVIIGVGNRAEIWSQQRWSQYSQEAASSFGKIAENLIDLGI